MLANRPEYERFRITDKDSWGVVASLLNEFGEEDKELCERLLDLIREARTREEEARRAANLSRARTDAVLGKMR
jgi:hypothetical protein